MTDWIANAESGSSVRAKLNTLMVPISSASISSPVEYVDIALPSGYDSFRLQIIGLKFDAGAAAGDDGLVALTSRDGGTTFDIDTGNYDTYLGPNIIKGANGTFDSVAADALSEVAGLIFLTGGLDTSIIPLPLFMNLDIVPGDAASYPLIMLFSASADHGGKAYVTAGFWMLNPHAIVPAPLGRINKLRLMPDGNEDSPPTSGETITAGRFVLFGIPSA